MRLAFCTEDPSDTDVLHAIAERALGMEVVPVLNEYVIPRSGGWTKALELAPKVARAVYHLGADGAVLAIDNDGSPAHETSHDEAPVSQCRTCRLRTSAELQKVLKWPRPALPPLQFIVAVPVQLLETWLLLSAERFPRERTPEHYGRSAAERRQLKAALYGNERADRITRSKVALPIARALDLDRTSARSPSLAHFVGQLRSARAAVADAAQ